MTIETDFSDPPGWPAAQTRVYHDTRRIFPKLVKEERRKQTRAVTAKYSRANLARRREYLREWRARNREHAREYAKRWHAEHST